MKIDFQVEICRRFVLLLSWYKNGELSYSDEIMKLYFYFRKSVNFTANGRLILMTSAQLDA
jgi:hypothetical protein